MADTSNLTVTASSTVVTVTGNEDLLSEILFRLPVNTLLSFKSVSKRWNSLISSDQFRRSYTIRNPNFSISGVFLHNYSTFRYKLVSISDSSSDSVSIPIPSGGGVRIVQSCNGLFLCKSSVIEEDRFGYFVYNPTTNEYRELPSYGSCNSNFNLAFDPNKSAHYKVISVEIESDCNPNLYSIHIYSSETGIWKKWSGKSFESQIGSGINFSDGVYWKNAINWVSKSNCSLYFDPWEEKLETFSSPVNDNRGEMGHLCECNGVLYYLDPIGAMGFMVYTMASRDVGWLDKGRVTLGSIELQARSVCRSIIGLVEDLGNGKAMVMVLGLGKILGYDLEARTCKKICNVASSDKFVLPAVYPYVQTLACV